MKRSWTRRRRAVVAVALASAVVPGLAACGPPGPGPAPVTVRDIGDLGGGSTTPWDIDDGGRVVGGSADAGGVERPFSWDGGEMTALPWAGAGGLATAVDGDLVAGLVRNGDGTEDPYFWEGGESGRIDVYEEQETRPVQVVDDTVLLAYRFIYGTSAILWRDGVAVTGPTLGGGTMDAGDINAHRQLVGRSTRYPDEPHVWSEAGGAVSLGTLGGTWGESHAVNDAGQVAGFSMLPGDQVGHAFLWEDGVMHDLGTLGGPTSTVQGPRSLSEAGHVVGTSDADGGRHAFLWHDGTMTDLGTLGGATSQPRAVNSHGQVVGVSETAGGERHAFLWDDGVMTDLTALAPGVVEVVDINDAGQAIGHDPASGRAVVFTARTG